jgi:protein-L-isoaspartate O-methyltransferase
VIYSINNGGQAYQNAASFVPKLATKVLEWLDVQPEDKILDVGCGGEDILPTTTQIQRG